MFDSVDPVYVFYAAIAGIALIVVETVYGFTSTAASYRGKINRRLGQLETTPDRQQAAVNLRRERGLGEIGVPLARRRALPRRRPPPRPGCSRLSRNPASG